jgi:hypothetical protein
MTIEDVFAWIARQGLPPEERVVARRLARRFLHDFGECPRLDPPRRYVEWMLHRLMFDRDPRLKVVADKVAMRGHVRGVLGHDPTLPLLQVHDSAEAIDWAALPRGVVLKASHGSGWNIRLRNAARADRAAVTARLREWLGRSLWTERQEWAYRGIPPRVLAEPLLDQPGCKRPHDICLYCIGGVPQYIRVNRYPQGSDQLSAGFDAALRPLGLYAAPATTTWPEEIDPAPLLDMARRLSAGFVYMRVDFMVAQGRAWLAELTQYPGGGRSTNFRDDAAEELVGTLYAAAQAGLPPPFLLDGRVHFRDPPGPAAGQAA